MNNYMVVLSPGGGPVQYRRTCLSFDSGLHELTASRRGRDKQGRDRGAATPILKLSWERVGEMWQTVATCGGFVALR